MRASNKGAALRYFSLAAAMAVAMALGLPSISFEPGMPLPETDAEGRTLVLPSKDHGVALPINKFIFTVILSILAAIVLAAAVRKIMGLDWKKILLFLGKALVAVFGFTLFLLILFNLFPRATLYPPAEIARIPPPASIYDGSTSPEMPATLVWIAAGATAFLALMLCLRLLRRAGSERGRADLVAIEAQAARLAILRGGNLKDLVLECYRRMSRAMEKERGIERKESMTAREFETLLEERGIAGESVRRLTALFESVRYGGREPSSEEESEAIDCLEAIEAEAKRGKAT